VKVIGKEESRKWIREALDWTKGDMSEVCIWELKAVNASERSFWTVLMRNCRANCRLSSLIHAIKGLK
jgi:hypothetical protein